MDITLINQNIDTSRGIYKELAMELNDNQNERLKFILKALNDKINFLEPKFKELLEIEAEIENLDILSQKNDIVSSMVSRLGLKATTETVLNNLLKR